MSTEPRYDTLGARVQGHGTLFSAWTEAKECALRLYERDGRTIATYPMEAHADGTQVLALPGYGHGTLYKFVLDGREVTDPYARFLPQGVHGPALVVEPRYAFQEGFGVQRPLSEHVFYELHIGTFTPEGTYVGARNKLLELARLGVTAIELMPLAAFAGERGWGYDGVAPFAPFAPYGTPDELRALIDEAHGLGLSVFLDVVYNHLGPAGNYFAAHHSGYFAKDASNPWGEALDFAHPRVRALVIRNALYWLEEFRFDGLRLDATHAILDSSRKHVLRELTEAVTQLEPKRLLIAEDDRNDPSLVCELGFDGVWADDFHHQLRVTLTGERDGYYAAYEPGALGLARTIQQGWLYEGQLHAVSGKPRGKFASDLLAEHFIYCIQNHDQVGNRALGGRLCDDVDCEAYGLASTLLLFLPMTPLLFMGQEWAASTPFLFFTDHEPELGARVVEGRRAEFAHFRAFTDAALRERIPNPQALETFERARLRWEERESAPHADVLSLYQELLALRRTDAVMRNPSREGLCADVPSADLLRVRRFSEGEERVLYANFSRTPIAFEELDLPAESRVLIVSTLRDERVLAPRTAAIFATQSVGVSS